MAIKKIMGKILAYTLLLGTIILTVSPFVWMIASSLKPIEEIFATGTPLFSRNPAWENYIVLFTNYHFHRAAMNSAIVAITSTAGAVFFCTLAGYAFNKFEFAGKNILFVIVLSSMMIPFESTMIPLYSIFLRLGLIDNHLGLIIPGLASAFGIFFIRQYMYGISTEILESGRIDGLKEFAIFIRLVIPMALPAMASLSIILFMGQWNSYLWPLILLRSRENHTLAIALANLTQAHPRFTPYHLLMAGSVVSITPLLIVFFAAQKQFIAGITSGAVKG